MTTTTFDALAQLIRETLSLGEVEIRPEQLLFYDLEFTSLDLLDLLFRIEETMGIPVPEGTIYRLARGELADELCAQIAGPLAEQALAARHGLERWAFLALVRHAAFYTVATLPIDLTITAELRRVEPSTVVVAVAAVDASRDDDPVCRGELVM